MRYKTCWEALNIVLRGGVKPPVMMELWGPPRSGKSLFAYDFCKRNKTDNSVIAILDTELTTDEVRLEVAFGLKKASYIRLSDKHVLLDGGKIVTSDISKDPNKYPSRDGDYVICVYEYMEQSFNGMRDILKACSPDKDIFIIYDSISSQATKAGLDGDTMWAGGRTETPRVLKHFTPRVLRAMYGKNAIVMFINHVYQGDFGKYESGGGNSFKHNMHMSLFFKIDKELTELDGTCVVQALSTVSAVKNKFGPCLKKGNMVISVKDGGIFMEAESLCADLLTYGIIEQKGGGWYTVKDLWGDSGKRYDDIVKNVKEDDNVREQMILLLKKKLYSIYPSIKLYEQFETSMEKGSERASEEG